MVKVDTFICNQFNNKCTSLGERISNSLIKTASTRIFAEPEQSIIELVVNSVDSYSVSSTPIGKFGMGFFSIFYWLSENHKRHLNIMSRYLDPLRDTKIASYGVKFQWTSSGLDITVNEEYDEYIVERLQFEGTTFNPKITGTLVEIYAIDVPFSDHNVNQFIKQLDKLFDIQGVSIYVNNILLNSVNEVKITVFISDEYIAVHDNAKGIPFSTLINVLIVPSYSTKMRLPFLKEKTASPSLMTYSVQIYNEFIITVNDVAVVKINFISIYKNGYTIVVRMPSTTQVPVARDDIIYKSNEIKTMKIILTQLIIFSINEYNDVYSILEMLDRYSQYSQQVEVTALIADMKQMIYTYKYIYVPIEQKVYNILRNMYPTVKFITHPYPRMYDTEKQLDELLVDKVYKNVYKLKNLVFLDFNSEAVYETGQLSKYLFISKKYILTQGWRSKLISVMENTILIPYDTPQTLQFWNDEYAITHNMNTHLYNALMTFSMTVTAKLETVEVQTDIKHIYLGLFNEYFLRDPQGVTEFIARVTSKFAEIVFDYTYGTRSLFIIRHQFVLFSDPINIDSSQDNKLWDINKRIGYWFINLWPQFPFTYYTVPYHSFDKFSSRFSLKNKSDDFIREIYEGLQICVNEAECLTFLNIMFLFATRKILFSGSLALGIGKFCVREIRHQASPEELIEMVTDSLFGYVSEYNISDKVAHPVTDALQLYVDMQYEEISDMKTPSGSVFTCKSLINYIFKNEYKDFDTMLFNITHDTELKLQIIEIAVNESTTKGFIQAVMTELVQNSMDAFRGMKGRIDINIKKNLMSITDTAGIPDTAFLALLVPFLSSKDPNDPYVVGEMGTGFFNVFRQPESQRVIIDTIYNNLQTIIECTPLVRDGIVYDISFNVTRHPVNNLGNKTTISLFFHPPYSTMIQSIADAQHYALNYLGFSDKAVVYINGQQIIKQFDVILTSPLGSIYLTQNIGVQSFIMTGGIPFAPLEIFGFQFKGIYKQLLADGGTRIIINLNKQSYTPVHSRTKINVSTQLESQLTKFINDGLFLAILTMYSNNEIRNADGIINNTSSKANIRQLTFSTIDQLLEPTDEDTQYTQVKYNSNFYVRYKINTLDIRGIINKFIVNESVTDIPDIVNKSVHKWFSNKDLTIPQEENYILIHTPSDSFIEDKDSTETSNNVYATPFTIIQPFIDLYWEIYKTLQKEGKIQGPILRDDSPQILIGESKNNFSGYYTPSKHIIYLNIQFYDPRIISQKLKEIPNTEEGIYLLRTTPVLADLFSPVLPLTTLAHELLHAVQSDEHHSADHHISTLIINGRKDLSFNTAGIEVYKLILKRGLINKFLSYLQKYSHM